ncbi:MAG: GNAT family N-acetyltransferase [Chloroflexaceae bacterium]|nr:GNAT family N-acetyltransferase [Chloroflexaceae bacterium]NJL33882.1 GNAT family N-acetyltransferase [Chloroflexaceae bacterium]NJO05007.1 GNAT family N-acetyltransferase [Chloroflexaceae bacterium]
MDPVDRQVLLSDLIIRPARLADVTPILALHQEAFADKFGGAFGLAGVERGSAALTAAWQRQGEHALRGMFVAEWQQQVIATTTLRTWEMGDDDPITTELAFQQVLGLWGATRSMFALSLLSHQIERGEGFITDVAVQAQFRRQGVARLLLERAAEQARRLRKRYLSLYVSGSNTGAIRLYTEMGFRRKKARHSFLTWLFFRQRTWFYMCKDLTIFQ